MILIMKRNEKLETTSYVMNQNQAKKDRPKRFALRDFCEKFSARTSQIPNCC